MNKSDPPPWPWHLATCPHTVIGKISTSRSTHGRRRLEAPRACRERYEIRTRCELEKNKKPVQIQKLRNRRAGRQPTSAHSSQRYSMHRKSSQPGGSSHAALSQGPQPSATTAWALSPQLELNSSQSRSALFGEEECVGVQPPRDALLLDVGKVWPHDLPRVVVVMDPIARRLDETNVCGERGTEGGELVSKARGSKARRSTAMGEQGSVDVTRPPPICGYGASHGPRGARAIEACAQCCS